MSATLRTVLLRTRSNVLMTYAWYGHLRSLAGRPWWIAALVSWGIAPFGYLLQVPASRIGFTVLTLPQLKMLQEVVTLPVFVPFSVPYMKQAPRLDFLWARLCLLGAVYLVFRGHGSQGGGRRAADRASGRVGAPDSQLREQQGLTSDGSVDFMSP